MASFSDSDLLDLDGSDTAVMHSTLSDSSPVSDTDGVTSRNCLLSFFPIADCIFPRRSVPLPLASDDRSEADCQFVIILSSVRANNEHGECILFRNVFTVRLGWSRRAHLFNRYFLLISRILLPYFLLVGCCFVVVFTTFHICSHECGQCWYQPGQSCHTRTELNSRMGGGLMHIRVGR